eukprot:scaffold66049_cov28-Tisochrysis_lutea.AAC.10
MAAMRAHDASQWVLGNGLHRDRLAREFLHFAPPPRTCWSHASAKNRPPPSLPPSSQLTSPHPIPPHRSWVTQVRAAAHPCLDALVAAVEPTTLLQPVANSALYASNPKVHSPRWPFA